MTFKLALKLCHFDILSNIEWLQQLNLIGDMGRQYFLHNKL